jgi:hypothetical protein
MFTGSPFYGRVHSVRWGPPAGAASWLLLMPGLSLIVLALAILVWPELLAYLVAGAILVAGLVLTGWGWGVRRAARRAAPRTVQQERYADGTVTYWTDRV